MTPAPLDTGTQLAIERTRIAGERTMMAWIRTALSMISFGFSMYKFFEYLRESQGPGPLPHGPRHLGLTLIGFGVLVLAVGAWQHVTFMRRLPETGEPSPRSASLIVAVCLGVLGVLLFVGTLAHVGPF
jgi:putative membrane protein